jgi:putative MATE family efflux protein
MKKHEIDMTNGPLLGKILLFAIPLMFSSILQLLFNAADIVVVGRFAGDNSLAAVGSTSALINLMVNLFVGLSVGANVLAAKNLGAKADGELHKTVHTAILLSMISGVVLAIVGVLFSRMLLEWMSSPEEVIGLSTLYLKIYFLGMPASMTYNFGAALLRAKGDTERPLIYLIIAGVVNVCLNLFFVILFQMDVAGVALATVISQCISAVLILRCLCAEMGAFHLSFKELHIDKKCLGQIVRVGLPAGFQGVVFSLSNVVIQASVNSFGNIVIAGNSAAANIEGFVYVAMNAFHQAAISFTGQNMGAGKYKRIGKTLLLCLACVTVVGIVLGNGAVLFGNQLLRIYSNDGEVIAAGLVRMRVICRTYALCGIMDVFVGALRGMGYAVMPMIVSLLGACGLRLLWIATVFQIPKYHTLTMLFASYPVSWAITGGVHLICFAVLYYRLIRAKMPNK